MQRRALSERLGPNLHPLYAREGFTGTIERARQLLREARRLLPRQFGSGLRIALDPRRGCSPQTRSFPALIEDNAI
jgi:hypothetical protein